MSNKFRVELHVDGIGPHRDGAKIDFVDEVESNKAIFFCPKWDGKNFFKSSV